jgi:hypothetical protein
VRPADERPLKARATWRLAAVMAVAVAGLALLAMGLQYRLVEGRLMQAQRALLAADLDGFAALYDQRRVIAVREAMALRAGAGGWRARCPAGPRGWRDRGRGSRLIRRRR